MEWIALLTRLLILNLIFNFFFVRVMRETWQRFPYEFDKAYFVAFVVSAVPTLVISDLLSQIQTIGPFLGFQVWGALSPLFAVGPVEKAVRGAVIIIGLILILTYLCYLIATAIMQLDPKHAFVRSLIIIGAFWLAEISVVAYVSWIGLLPALQNGFAPFVDGLEALSLGVPDKPLSFPIIILR
jgi:hypothetical protein